MVSAHFGPVCLLPHLSVHFLRSGLCIKDLTPDGDRGVETGRRLQRAREGEEAKPGQQSSASAACRRAKAIQETATKPSGLNRKRLSQDRTGQLLGRLSLVSALCRRDTLPIVAGSRI